MRQNSMLEGTHGGYSSLDFSKIKVGTKTLEDAVLTIGEYRRTNPVLGDKKEVLRAINMKDIERMREISDFFYRTSGIYSRLCRYMAYLYKYDWFITPYIDNCEGLLDQNSNGFADLAAPVDEETGEPIVSQPTQEDKKRDKNRKKQFNNFFKVLRYFEVFQVKRFFGEVALKVIRHGCYYGYLISKPDRMVVQELPIRYCRTRYKINNRPVIEFNMHYFDDYFHDEKQRMAILNLFPADFKKGYNLYRKGKLMPTFPGDSPGWYLLDPKCAIKFNLNEEDYPAFISVIPALIDLDMAQDLDRRKMAQKLMKIIVQKMPIDKNGDLIFDLDEVGELHNNAVRMLTRAIGVDVLTTFADVDVADMSDRGTTTTVDQLAKVERTVFNEAGTSQQQFNSDNNTALNNSILNDEASMYNLLVQFESFLNLMLEPFNKSPKKCWYQAQLLTTTIYNYKDMAKLYKEQAQMGYNKMLPAIALGQTQSSVLANAYFENDILDLVRVFVPPLTSNVMNAEAISSRGMASKKKSSSSGKAPGSSSNEGAGRPQKEDNQKSEKTLKNKESM